MLAGFRPHLSLALEASFLQAGARVAALGSALADPTQLEKVLTLLPANHS